MRVPGGPHAVCSNPWPKQKGDSHSLKRPPCFPTPRPCRTSTHHLCLTKPSPSFQTKVTHLPTQGTRPGRIQWAPPLLPVHFVHAGWTLIHRMMWRLRLQAQECQSCSSNPHEQVSQVSDQFLYLEHSRCPLRLPPLVYPGLCSDDTS